MKNKETALITGITGQDGSYLADFLLDKGYRVVGLARRSSRLSLDNIEHLMGKIELAYGDLLDQNSLEIVVAEYKPDEVYNFAAQSVPADSWSQPAVTGEITALGVTRMLESVRKHRHDARFYQASSREIFGGVDQAVMNEQTPYLPNNPYGIAKLYAHLMVRNYRESYGMAAVGGILFNHESPRRSLHFITRKITMGAACVELGVKSPPLNEKGEPLVVDGKITIGNLDAKRDWGYAKEYVVAAWLMLQQDHPTDYVIASNTLHSVRDVCAVAFGHVGLDWRDHVITSPKFFRPTEISASQGDYSKAKKELGWEPKTSFADLICMMVEQDMHMIRQKRLR